jgi:hypothetical protein
MSELVYILAPSYSGSTLLALLLGRHPAIATVGELKRLVGSSTGPYQCSCGVEIHQCGFWKQLKQEVNARGAHFDVDDLGARFDWPERRWLHRVLRARVRGAAFEALRECVVRFAPGCRSRIESIALRNELLIEVISKRIGGTTFLDSSKDPARLHWMMRSRLWKMRVIHLTRDGRGTALSAMRHEQSDMALAAVEYRRTHEECLRLASRLGNSRSMTLRYEDLCKNPRLELNRVATFLDLPPESETLEAQRTEQHVLGNEMRLLPDTEIRLDERWKGELDPGDLAIFERIAGKTNRLLGYS